MTSTARCNQIIALIDECLADYDSTLVPVRHHSPVTRTRTPPRHPELVRSAW